MEKEDTVSVQWAQEDVETSYSLLNDNKRTKSMRDIRLTLFSGRRKMWRRRTAC